MSAERNAGESSHRTRDKEHEPESVPQRPFVNLVKAGWAQGPC